MADRQVERRSAGADDSKTRLEWVKPEICDMVAGAAELGGDTNVDGDPGLS
ncbi:MAG TPA: hypothetical protein VF650_02415 [Allosphingosinicella sp.]|jgi:hypothetical protein